MRTTSSQVCDDDDDDDDDDGDSYANHPPGVAIVQRAKRSLVGPSMHAYQQFLDRNLLVCQKLQYDSTAVAHSLDSQQQASLISAFHAIPFSMNSFYPQHRRQCSLILRLLLAWWVGGGCRKTMPNGYIKRQEFPIKWSGPSQVNAMLQAEFALEAVALNHDNEGDSLGFMFHVFLHCVRVNHMYCEALTWSPTQFLDGSVYSIDPLIPGSCREACKAHPLTDCFAIPSCYQPILEPFLQLG